MTEALQNSRRWVGYDMYNSMPFNSDLLRHHASGFFGCYGVFYFLKLIADTQDKIRSRAIELSGLVTFFLMAVWEVTHINNHFDWGDMATYGAAIGVAIVINKSCNNAHGNTFQDLDNK
jgi:hypothetical protein